MPQRDCPGVRQERDAVVQLLGLINSVNFIKIQWIRYPMNFKIEKDHPSLTAWSIRSRLRWMDDPSWSGKGGFMMRTPFADLVAANHPCNVPFPLLRWYPCIRASCLLDRDASRTTTPLMRAGGAVVVVPAASAADPCSQHRFLGKAARSLGM
jgi:hypothetical protein